MTWYEWGLCCDRIQQKYREHENQIDLQRHLMSLIANVNGNKTVPDDFLQPEKEGKKISEEDLKEKLKNRKKKNG